MADFFEITVDKFIFKVATNCSYSPEGVWAFREGTRVRLGLTDYQQQHNGDMAFVHLQPVGTTLASGDEFAEVETIKATVSCHVPVAGTVVQLNQELALTPELVNQDPYGRGWLVELEAKDWSEDVAKLLDAHAYLDLIQAQAKEELNP